MTNVPKATKHDQRICFGISWFKTEDDAKAYEADVKKRNRRVNGGYFHDMPCGRAPHFDYVDKEHGQLYAVTD